jgi:iron complex transport system ATP-binding protein
VLRVEALTAHYGRSPSGQRPLLFALSFVVPAPAFVAIVGHNGSGKSTLFKALSNQLPYEGTVAYGQQPLRPGINPAAQGWLALLEQRNLLTFDLPVRELIVMGRFRHKAFLQPYDAQDYALADAALARLGMTHLRDRTFRQLSGGEQQLVWLAQLELQAAPVCLLDEPTQQLDLYHKRRVFDQMYRWTQDDGRTVLCITHDLPYLAGYEGYLLNLSAPQPALEVLSADTLRYHTALLERPPNQNQ